MCNPFLWRLRLWDSELESVRAGMSCLGEGALGVRGTEALMTENDVEWEWRRQSANLRFFRLAWGLQGAMPIPVPGWNLEASQP